MNQFTKPQRILFITPEAPWPPTAGGRQRANLMHRALAQYGEVDTLCVRHTADIDEQALSVLNERFGFLTCLAYQPRAARLPWSLVRPLAPALVGRLAHNFGRKAADFEPDPGVAAWIEANLTLADYAVVVAYHLLPLTKTGLLGKRPVLLDVDDYPTSVYRGRLQAPDLKRWEQLILNKHLAGLQACVPGLLAQCDGLYVSKQSDLNEPGCGNAVVLPNIPWAEQGQAFSPLPDNANSKTLTMVGAFNYQPNIEGVNHFLNQIWPAIRRAEPEAQFHIVGSKMSESLKQQWARHEGVTPLGFVEQLEDAYREAAVSVVPVYFGGGSNIKVLEALAFGRACVVTSAAHRGYEHHLRHGQALSVAENDEQFARAVIDLLEHPEQRAAMAGNGHNAVMQHFSITAFQSQCRKGLDRLGLQPTISSTS